MGTLPEKEIRSRKSPGERVAPRTSTPVQGYSVSQASGLLPLAPAHLDALWDLVQLSPECHWERKDFAYFLSHPCQLSYGFWEDSRLVAFIVCLFPQREIDVIYLFTHPDERRQGIAQKVLQGVLVRADLRSASLEVSVKNAPAIALYEKLGFSIQRVRRKYYQGKEDAYFMLYTPKPSTRSSGCVNESGSRSAPPA